MKKSFLSRLFKTRERAKCVDKPLATHADIRRKLERYQSTEGPARFGNADVYFVSEEVGTQEEEGQPRKDT